MKSKLKGAKKRATKTAAPKKTGNKNPYAATRVCKNIDVFPSGVYRGRKMINGVAYTENFTSLTNAKKWLKGFTV